MRNADLLILDEPNAGLDPSAEESLIATLATANGAMLFVSHRLGAIRNCDLIVVMAGGCVVEQGTHDDLIAEDGAYASLFRAQAARFRSAEHAAPVEAR
jgi:ATP-binding cassette subfamily B protein